MAKYECTVCGYVYDPELGDSEGDIEPETHLKNCQKTGYVPSAAPPRVTLKR